MKNMKPVSYHDRLKNMVIIDKKENPQRIERLLKSELLYVLKNYFDISYEDLDVSLGVTEEGEYALSVSLLSKVIKIAKCF